MNYTSIVMAKTYINTSLSKIYTTNIPIEKETESRNEFNHFADEFHMTAVEKTAAKVLLNQLNRFDLKSK